MIDETPEAKALRMKNLEHVRACRELLVNDRSLVRLAFERLTSNQKRYLLIASGLDTYKTDWQQLSDSDVKRISIGIKRLQGIIKHFINCQEIDFQKSPSESRSERFNEQSLEQSLKQLGERADLVAQLTKGESYANQANTVF